MSHLSPSYPTALRRYIGAVVVATIPVVVAAAVAVARDVPGPGLLAGAIVFLVAALAAELKPVPLDDKGERTVSLAFVFLLASQVLFGWEYAVIAAIATMAAVQLVERPAPIRGLFNTATYGLSAFASGLPGLLLGLEPVHGAGTNYDVLAVVTFVGGAAYVSTNVALVCGAVALNAGVSLRRLLEENARHSGPPFAIMAFIAALAASLWTVEPRLELLLAGPLFALALYQRYAYRSVIATRDAGTDALTGLRNHRSFHTDLRDALALAASTGDRVALALVDIDDFKTINDRFGHPVGDHVLATLAEVVREVGKDARGYRVGGEEFAILHTGAGEDDAFRTLERLHARLWETTFDHGEPVTVSAGIAAYPASAADRDELLRVADGALYWAKNNGKSRSCIYSPSVVRIYSPQELAQRAERQARLRAAEGLIRVVDVKDTYNGAHSQSVSRLSEGIAREMGLDDETVEQIRLAGLLHDLGKIAIPDGILQKPGRLTDAEFAVMREHPVLGYRLLEGLGVSPVDKWILHHHEWWDGSGYPSGLVGEDTPLGSRIITVADAFDAMTSDRCYRAAGSTEGALAELRRKAWTQFDARCVAALERHLGAAPADRPAEAVGA